MNDWQVIKKNGWLPAVANCYLPEFPMEARSLLADWLWQEDNRRVLSMEEGSLTMDQQYQCIYGFLQNMMIKFKQGIDELPTPKHDEALYSYKNSLNIIYSQMERLFAADNLQLFRSIQESLKNEKHRLIELNLQNVDSKPGSQMMQDIPRKPCEILNETVIKNIENARQICASIEHTNRSSNSRWNDFQTNLPFRLQQMHAGPNGVNNEAQINRERNQLHLEIQVAAQKCLASKVQSLSRILDELEAQILPELEDFKDQQRFVAMGKIPEHNLLFIQNWFEGTYKCLCDLEKCLPDFACLCQNFNFDIQTVQSTLAKVSYLRNKMIISCLVVDTQPHQIIRKATKFGPVRLRVLLSTSSLIIDEKAIVASLIDEGQASALHSNPEHVPEKSGDLKFGKGYPRVINNVVEFKDLRVSEIKRKVKRGEKSVVEEKFCIYFKLSVNMQGHSFTAWTTSLPLTVTSHPNQEGEAWGTILWDNGFSMRGRKPFKVPEEVPWSALIEVIDLRFMSLTDDRRGLTADNKRYLKSKIFRNEIPANGMVNWKLFCKDAFIEITKEFGYDEPCNEDQPKKKSITFWEWVFSTLKLLSWCPEDPKLADQSLRRLWSQNKIVGHISEAEMIEMLRVPNKLRPGTFVLRFSEKRPESIGVYYYNHRTQNAKESPLVKLKPYTIKELKQTPLQDRIIKNPLISYLYPEEDKHKAFTRTSSKDHKTIDGYVDVGTQEYFSSSMLERYKPGLPLPDFNTPSPSSHTFSYQSQALSPGRSDYDISNPHWHSSSASIENSPINVVAVSSNASALDEFYEQDLPELMDMHAMDMNEVVQNWMQGM
ncbi:Signal transducer and activator of transcription 5B [Orchesella cincta]|uniref:Signal transducer and activator of transcription 5B n=1 Tax=Orchesella cincta TaxID=48709 RepID=A0A1D2MM54_ORCCI|nr:Signal transducer and activator of transcription 5B [Orchesella cincta]